VIRSFVRNKRLAPKIFCDPEKTMTEFNDEIAAIRSHTVSYASDPEFHADWFGLTRRSVNLRALLARRLRDTNGA